MLNGKLRVLKRQSLGYEQPMFGLSGEHLLILGAVILIFGPRKLPELGSSIGKALRNFKEGLNHPTSSGSVGSSSADAPPPATVLSQPPLNSLSELHNAPRQNANEKNSSTEYAGVSSVNSQPSDEKFRQNRNS